MVLLVFSACVTDWGEPNPTIVADGWANEGCEQHGGTCSGNAFGCGLYGNQRLDESLACPSDGSDFPPACCLPSDAGVAAVEADAEAPSSDARAGGPDVVALDGSPEGSEAGPPDAPADGP